MNLHLRLGSVSMLFRVRRSWTPFPLQAFGELELQEGFNKHKAVQEFQWMIVILNPRGSHSHKIRSTSSWDYICIFSCLKPWTRKASDELWFYWIGHEHNDVLRLVNCNRHVSRGLGLVEALRIFLATFRLPGEVIETDQDHHNAEQKKKKIFAYYSMKLIWTKSSVKQETNLQDFKTKGLKIKNWKLDNRTTYPCASILTPWGAVHWAAHGEFCRGRLPFQSDLGIENLPKASTVCQSLKAYFRSQPIADGSLAALGWETWRTGWRGRGNTLKQTGSGRLSSHDPCLCLTVYILDFMILYMIVWLCYYYQFPWYHKYSCILLCPICPRWRRGQPALCASIARKRTQMIESVGQLRNVTRTSLKIRWLWHAGPWALRMDGTLQTVVARLQDATCQSQHILS